MNHRTQFRVVVDGNPSLPEPVTRFEQHIPPLGWRPVTNGAVALSKLQTRWSCRIEAVDSDSQFDYSVEIGTKCNVSELDQVMQTYAKNLLEGLDPKKISKLLLTATAIH